MGGAPRRAAGAEDCVREFVALPGPASWVPSNPTPGLNNARAASPITEVISPLSRNRR